MKTDPVTIEILATKLRAVAEEMGFALQRSGRTLYVKETADFGTGIANLDGKLIAYPNCVGVSSNIDIKCKPTIDAGGALKPGDVLATNHPYLSAGLATHLPDIHLVKPYFVDGELIGYGWSFVHSADVGGRVPSSISPSNTELFQEGLLIPPMKLCREGVLNEDLLAFIRANTRTAEENIGDIKAMLAALQVGERRIQKVIQQHGMDVYKQGIEDVVSYTEAKARAAFRTIPDGDYEFCDYLDDDLISPIPVRLHAIRADSGGAGRWRGGVGLELTFSPHHAGSSVLGRGMDRFRFEPWGLLGGMCGVNARTILNHGRQDEKELGKIDMVELGPDDTITIMTPGGGGYGDPLERDPECVRIDVERGFVSLGMARSAYGVEVGNGGVDAAATRELREMLRARRSESRAKGIFEFGPNRLAWESVFDDRMMRRINAVLAPLPPAARRLRRQALFAPVIDVLGHRTAVPQAEIADAARLLERSLLTMEATP